MKVFEFFLIYEYYCTIAYNKEEAIDKIINYMISKINNQITINNLINATNELNNLKYQLSNCNYLEHDITHYVGYLN